MKTFPNRGYAEDDGDRLTRRAAPGIVEAPPMPQTADQHHRSLLNRIARRVMSERGLAPDVPPAAILQLAGIRETGAAPGPGVRDLRHMIWCSIDNDDSRDLDQLTVAEDLGGGAVRALVAVADVDWLVTRGTAIDAHAAENTTSVYTAGGIFPMLPERLSTDLTSLGPDTDRRAVVVDMTFGKEGALQASSVYPAVVRNRAKLAYAGVASWLTGGAPMPAAVGPVGGLADNLRLQNTLAESVRSSRHARGALTFRTLEAHPVFDGESLRDLVPDEANAARVIIEELIVAANGVTARFLEAAGLPSIRRVVRTPSKWDRIVEIAASKAFALPSRPDGKALEAFLVASQASDPESFPELSLCIIKLLGRGEYTALLPGGKGDGHFGLAVDDYSHATAPNRRYPDIIIQRLLKAAAAGLASPYGDDELAALAKHCSDQEQSAKKVERQVMKSAGALLLCNRIGETFVGHVTGAADKGTWIRIAKPAVEGRVTRGFEGLRVGDKVRVKLVSTNVEHGHIDFTVA